MDNAEDVVDSHGQAHVSTRRFAQICDLLYDSITNASCSMILRR